MRTLLTSAGVACAIALALCFSALSASFWIIELTGQHRAVIAIAVIGSVCVSLLGPACAFLSRSYSWALLVPAMIFIGADCYQNTLGYQTFKGLTVSSEVEAAEARLATAQKALDDLPLPNASGQIRQLSTWTALNLALTERRDAARADLQALAPTDTSFWIVGVVMAVIQFALSLIFGCLGKRRTRAMPLRSQPRHKRTEHLPYDPEIVNIMDRINKKMTAV